MCYGCRNTVSKLSGLKSGNVCIVSQLWRLPVQNQHPLPPHSHFPPTPSRKVLREDPFPPLPQLLGSVACGSITPLLHNPGRTCLCVQISFFCGHQSRRIRAHPAPVRLTLTNHLGHNPVSFSGPGSQSFNIEIGGEGSTHQPERHAMSYWSLWSKGKSEILISPYLKW